MTDRRIKTTSSRLLLVQLAALSAGWSAATAASEIYKWVSDDGVVHYSDTRPRHSASVTTLYFEKTNSEDYDPNTDPYSILNQAKRANQSWTERVAARQQARTPTSDVRQHRKDAFSPYLPFVYYPTTAFQPLVLPPPRRRNPGAARRQLNALEALDLVGRRPQSINSGVHRDRVLRSEALPIVSPDTSRAFPSASYDR